MKKEPLESINEQVEDLKQLGAKKTRYPQTPEEAKLESFSNKHPNQDYLAPFVCNEFTSLCPKTAQPDFAKIEIVYVPNKLCVESKSLKLYLFAFRNHGEFHEDVINRIFKDLWYLLEPRYMRIFGDFYVRGGISIKPTVMKFNASINTFQKEDILSLVENYDRKTHFDN